MDLDETPWTPDDLAFVDRMRTPAWIVILERASRWWCNHAGLALWNSPSREEWVGRNEVHPPSEATLTRMASMRRRFERGEVATERWTFYPDGAAPVIAECRASGLVVADRRGEPGRVAMLVEARPLGADETYPSERRSYEALRFLGELVSYYGAGGHAILRNPAAVRALGDLGPADRPSDQLAASFADPAEVVALRERLAAGAVYRADVLVHTADGDRWYDTEARATLDPVTGERGVLVTQRDIADRRAQVAELERSRALLAAQAEALRRLAAPVMRVGPGVLALPLIGRLDRERLAAATAALAGHRAAERVVRVVLDLTGAEVDADAAAGLLRLARVLRLQGIAAALSGITPQVAAACARDGLDLAAVPCFQSLADALRG
jgi:rsbT co-antagonist protein RsbR